MSHPQIRLHDVFGRLTITSGPLKKGKRKLFQCECDCGVVVSVRSDALLSGKTKSCGCLRHDRNHGECNTRLYNIWANMKARCLNPNTPCFKYYGGKGISIYNDWLDFRKFKIWAKNSGYLETLTIERRDADGDYCPDNCTWLPLAENNRNRKGAYSNSKSGVKGVYFHKILGKWAANPQYKGRRKFKIFNTFEDACEGIEKLKNQLKKEAA